MKFLSNKDLVAKSPVLTTFLLEWANVSQLWQMWTQQTARGQSLLAWISVQVALWIWINYYRVLLPEHKFPRVATLVGCGLNLLVILSVCYFRMTGRG